MSDVYFKDKCKINTNIDDDVFVGLKYENGDIKISFPIGFHLASDEEGIRKDIRLLLNILSSNSKRLDSRLSMKHKTAIESVLFPLHAYLYIIKDYRERGYYKEREVNYHIAKQGKISWNKTIKTQRAYIQDDEIFYLDFVTRKNQIKQNELITQIHEFCVYESFKKIGWLFVDYIPQKPRIRWNYKLFSLVVRDKLAQTFNDKNRQLFNNMLQIIDSRGANNGSDWYHYGTNRFEYIWESMIDRVFGVENKADYYPKTTWKLGNRFYDVNQTDKDNSSLRPDTIMIVNKKIYVLDAKYYKYGWSGNPGHLPESTSINKQITYGEYIAELRDNSHPVVYNAFIMPYDAHGEKFHTEEKFHYIGLANGNWKMNDKSYENVEGILIDVKYIMQNSDYSKTEIYDLAELIEQSLKNSDI